MNRTHTNNKRTVLYCRVSTKRQADKADNLPEQKRQCREYCRREGLEIVKEFVDPGESARSADRPEFQKMLAFCRENKVGYVVVQKLDRFARNLADQTREINELWAKHGIRTRSTFEQIDESSTGKLLANISGSYGQFFSDQLSEQMALRSKSAVERGLFPWRAPYGFLNVKATEGHPNIVPDPERAPYVSRAFELVASGEYKVAEVLNILTQEGMLTRKGKPFAKETFAFMLRNRVYRGMVSSTTAKERRGLHAQLVSDEVFDQAQDVLDGRRKKFVPHRKINPDFPLKGIRCSLCNAKLTGSKSRGRNGKRHSYYHCQDCAGVRIRAEVLEAEFHLMLNRLNPRSEIRAEFPAILARVWSEKQADVEVHRAGVTRQLTAAIGLRDGLIEKYIAGKIADSVYERTAPLYEAKVSALEAELRECEASAAEVDGFVDFGELLLVNMARLWEQAQPEERVLVRTLLFSEQLLCSENGRLSNRDNPCLFNVLEQFGTAEGVNGSSGRTRTYNPSVNSRMLCH